MFYLFFIGDKYYRFSHSRNTDSSAGDKKDNIGTTDRGFPKKMTYLFPWARYEGVDAAFTSVDEVTYFFDKCNYYKFNNTDGSVSAIFLLIFCIFLYIFCIFLLIFCIFLHIFCIFLLIFCIFLYIFCIYLYILSCTPNRVTHKHSPLKTNI